MGIFILFYVYAHTGFKLKTEGSSCQRYKMALFHYKKSIKGMSDLTNPYVHSMFVLLLTKQFFETNHWGQCLKARHSFGLELSRLHMWMPECSLPIWNMFFEFVDDGGKEWCSCPDDGIYKQNNDSENFSLVTKNK